MQRSSQDVCAALEEQDFSAAAPLLDALGVSGLIASQYYELRLAAHDAQVDYLVVFDRERATLLQRAIAERVLRERAYQCEGWHKILRVLDDWVRGGNFTGRRTPAIWFELDAHAQQPAGAVPSLSVCLAPDYRADEPVAASSAEDAAHAQELLQRLGASSEQRSRASEAFELLPAGARWIHLSSMLGRERVATKLYGVMRRAQLLPYLARIGWAGDPGAVAAALVDLYPQAKLGDELYLDLNLEDFRDAERVSLGLAVAQQHLRQAAEPDPTRRDILSAWVEAGLCDAQKAAFVEEWPRSIASRRQHLLQRDFRYLDVKLVWRANSGWSAKAYLGRELKRGFL